MKKNKVTISIDDFQAGLSRCGSISTEDEELLEWWFFRPDLEIICYHCGKSTIVKRRVYNERLRKSKSKRLFCNRQCGLEYARSQR